MGGYVTQTRKSPGYVPIPFKRETISSTGVVTPGSSGNWDPAAAIASQVTSSYRSSGDLLGQTAFRGGTLGSALQAIRTLEHERGTEWDNGHEFNTVKSEIDMSHPMVDMYRPLAGGAKDHLKGPMRVSFLSPTAPNYGGLTASGTKAIALTTPGNSPADVTQALIELRREGLPSLFGVNSLRNRAQVARNAGSEYLNVQFGWIPLVNDIVDTMGAASRSEQLLLQFRRNSGRHVRRQMDFEPIVTQTFSEGIGTMNNGTVSNINTFQFYNQAQTRWTRQTKTTVSVSFSGAFTYYIPPNLVDRGVLGMIERANYLYGLDLDPELLWNIAPWSWLSDWFVNIGDIITNVSNFQVDGTVMRYAYIMATTVVASTYTMKLFPVNGSTGVPSFLTTTIRTIRKQRSRATPYGFGLNPATFTGRQWAILGALGMTRGNQSIRYSE